MAGPGARKTLSDSRFLRFFVLGALYFAQGIPWGFISVGYVVFLTDHGLDNTAVGAAIGLAYVPWSFKPIWGPLIDRFPSLRFGRRRPYIIGAQLLMGLTILMLLAIDVHDLKLVGALLFLHNTFAAMQDVATDALAVDVLPEAERGTANSVMWAAKSGGVWVGGGGGTLLAKYLGWSALFVTIAVAIWLIMMVSVLVRERPRATEPGNAAEPTLRRLSLREVWRSFNFQAPLVGLLIGALTPVGYALVASIFVRIQRAELKLSEAAIASLSGTIDPLASVVGAIIGGILADRLGARRVIGISMLLIAATLAVFAATPTLWPSYGFLAAWVAANALVIAAYNAASLGFFMTLSNPAIGATQFSLFMATTNLTYAWTSPAGGYIADRWGVPTLFAVAAVLQILPIALLPLCDPKSAEARFRAA